MAHYVLQACVVLVIVTSLEFTESRNSHHYIQKDMEVQRRHVNRLLLNESSSKEQKNTRLRQWGDTITLVTRITNGDGCGLSNDASYLLMYVVARHVGPVRCIPSANPLKALRDADIISYPLPHMGLTETLYPLTRNNLCVMLPRTSSERAILTETFTPSLWVALIATVSVFWLVRVKLDPKGAGLETLRTVISGAFIPSQRPLGNFISLLLCFFSIIMVSLFSGNEFVKLLATERDSHIARTLEEAEAKVKIFRTAEELDLLEDFYQTDNVLRRINHKFDKHRLRNEKESEIGWFMTEETFSLSKRVEPHQSHYLVDECLISPNYPVSPVNPDWPFKERFSGLLQRACEGGLYHILKSCAEESFYLYYMGDDTEYFNPTQKAEPLTTSTLVQPAILLFFGLSAATIVFALELVVKRLSRRRNHAAYEIANRLCYL